MAKRVTRQLRMKRLDNGKFQLSFDPGDDVGDSMEFSFGVLRPLQDMCCEASRSSRVKEQIVSWEEPI